MPKMGMEPVRRKQVINATLECIAENGFEGLTLDTVARKAGVSKGVVSYYFKGKEDLILQSFEAFLDHYYFLVGQAMSSQTSVIRMFDEMIDIVVSPQALSNSDKTLTDTETFIMVSSDQYFRLLVHYYSRIVRNPKLRKMYHRLYDQYFNSLVEILKYGHESGEIAVNSPDMTAYAIMTQLDGAILYEALEFQPLNKNTVVDVCKHTIRKILL